MLDITLRLNKLNLAFAFGVSDFKKKKEEIRVQTLYELTSPLSLKDPVQEAQRASEKHAVSKLVRF